MYACRVFYIGRALTSAVNEFAAGLAPKFLRKFVAGGVSIALEKSKTAVRPLSCGDPILRSVHTHWRLFEQAKGSKLVY